MIVLCFVLMVCWNQHMAGIEMYIFSVNIEMYIFSVNVVPMLKYTHGMVILDGHASTEPVNSSFRGNPYLITRLYSLKYKVSLVWCMWIECEFHTIFLNNNEGNPVVSYFVWFSNFFYLYEQIGKPLIQKGGAYEGVGATKGNTDYLNNNSICIDYLTTFCMNLTDIIRVKGKKALNYYI